MLSDERIDDIMDEHRWDTRAGRQEAARAIEREARQQALEEAAKVCDSRVTGESGCQREDYENRQCARIIRALKEKP